MRKRKIVAAVILSMSLAIGPAAGVLAQPTEESQTHIVNDGPSGQAEETKGPAESGPDQGSTDTSSQPGNSGQSGVANGADSLAQPVVQAEGAVLLDASTGTVLYGKNENTQFFPASITKLMTALLVIENCSLDDKVTFSKAATTNLEAGSVTLNLTEGDVLSVKDCLYALLLKSANEVANGLAEKVSGSVSAFAQKMNDRAKQLGCKNTHFVNPNGLNSDQHYTTPYDMALIARAAFSNEILRKIDSTLSYKIPATKKVNKERTVTMGHKMFYSTDSRYYPGIIGGKTGYTSKAGNTLVTGVERDGVTLIAVVMKAKGTHYQDTKALLDYGFANRDKILAAGGAAGITTTPAEDPASPDGNKNTDNNGNNSNSNNNSGNSTDNGNNNNGNNGNTAGETTPASEQSGYWMKDGNQWSYMKPDGTKAAGEWLKIGSEEFWFDANGLMATGWRQFTNGAWYYFKEDGTMAKNCWAQNTGNWFYLGPDGAMLKNTVTPDGYRVDEYGIRQ